MLCSRYVNKIDGHKRAESRVNRRQHSQAYKMPSFIRHLFSHSISNTRHRREFIYPLHVRCDYSRSTNTEETSWWKVTVRRASTPHVIIIKVHPRVCGERNAEVFGEYNFFQNVFHKYFPILSWWEKKNVFDLFFHQQIYWILRIEYLDLESVKIMHELRISATIHMIVCVPSFRNSIQKMNYSTRHVQLA